jgi:rhodanese-related sulfurtransferase
MVVASFNTIKIYKYYSIVIHPCASFSTLYVEPDELMMDMPFDENLVVVDVRRETEFADGHIKGAVNLPLSNLTDPGSMADIDDTDNLYIHCGSGYRSVFAASLMKRQGIHNLRNVIGGWDKIK